MLIAEKPQVEATGRGLQAAGVEGEPREREKAG